MFLRVDRHPHFRPKTRSKGASEGAGENVTSDKESSAVRCCKGSNYSTNNKSTWHLLTHIYIIKIAEKSLYRNWPTVASNSSHKLDPRVARQYYNASIHTVQSNKREFTFPRI
jgi:hypothetical protein